MTQELKDIMLYICEKYPYKNELSNARLTKLIYLSDWKNVLKNKEQISDIKWVFNHYGPFVNNIMIEANQNSEYFEVHSEVNMYGHIKQVINNKQNLNINFNSLITDDAQCIINSVIEKTKSKTWTQFIQYVYSTYPVLISEKGTELNLIDIEKKYRDVQLDFQENKS